MASLRKVKCPYCSFTNIKEKVINHIELKHEDMIPQGFTAARVLFNFINKKDHGTCVICKGNTAWNEKTNKYNRLCNKPECKNKLREIYKKNMLKVYGKTTLLNDPEQQKKMLANRSISGVYKFSNGKIKEYTGSFEKKFLQFMDTMMGYDPDDIQSIEDILEICRFSKKRHNFGFMYRGDTENNIVVDFLPILRSCGGWVVDENNHPTVNTPEFKIAMEVYLELIDTGRAAKKDDVIAAIANKSGTMCVGWPGWYTPTRNSSMGYIALSGKYGRGSEAYNSNIYGIWTIGVPANSANKEYGVKLVEFLMNPKNQQKSVSKGGVPCRYSSLRDDPEILKNYPEYKLVCKALESGVYRPTMVHWNDFYTILGRRMKMIFDGERTIEAGLKEAQTELERRLGK